MRFEIVAKGDKVLATFDPSAGLTTSWTGTVPETAACFFRMYMPQSERAAVTLKLAGESLQAIAERQDAASARQVKFEWKRHSKDIFQMPCWSYFENMAGPIRIVIQSRRFGARGHEMLCDSDVVIDPVKFGGLQNRTCAIRTLEESPFSSLFKVGGPLVQNSTVYEAWAFECIRAALENVGGLKLNPKTITWGNAVQGCPYTTGPVLDCDINPTTRLRLRHEPLVLSLAADIRDEALYTLVGNQLRPDIAVEVLKKEDGRWITQKVVIGDCKYAEASGQTRLYKWSQIDEKYAMIVTARREAIRQLWLISSGGTSDGVTAGPADGTIFDAPYFKGHVFATRGFTRAQLVVRPDNGHQAHFEAFAQAALTTLLEGSAA